MESKKSATEITLLIAITYGLLGNIIGYLAAKFAISDDSFLVYLFIPYTFNWILSSLAGFDWLSFVFELLAFGFSILIFYPLGLYFGISKTVDAKIKVSDVKIKRPSMKEIEDRILEIESLDLSSIHIDAIKEKLNLLFTGYVLSTPFFYPEFIVYRGISYEEKPKTLSYLSYPPKENAKINRASREQESYFYCTTAREVPFFELDLKVGDKVVISKWKTTRNLLLNNIGYTDSNFADLNSNRENKKWIEEEEGSEILKEENILIQNFLAKTFSQKVLKGKEELYKLTIAIAEKHYLEKIATSTLEFEGLLYPSIPMKANADNLAIRPSFIDSGGLIFEEVEYIEVTEKLDFSYNINVLDWANSISKSGEIDWKGRLPQWTIPSDMLYVESIEEGKQVFRDMDGNIIPYH